MAIILTVFECYDLAGSSRRARLSEFSGSIDIWMDIDRYTYIYIYIHTYREREREIDGYR